MGEQKARGAAGSLAARPIASCASRLSIPASGEGAGQGSGIPAGPLLLPAAPRRLSSSSASSEHPPVPQIFSLCDPTLCGEPHLPCSVQQLMSTRILYSH